MTEKGFLQSYQGSYTLEEEILPPILHIYQLLQNGGLSKRKTFGP